MSSVSFMEKLLDGVEIEWKALADIASFRRGSFPQPYGNSDWYDGEGSMPFVQVVDVLDNCFYLKETTKQRISKLAQPKSVFVEEGTVIVTLQGTIGRVAITQYDCYLDRTLAIFTNYIQGINKKYFAYQLKSKFDIEKKNARGSTLKTITKEEFSKFKIPIPCPENPKKSLEIQAEIVRILDTFTELATKLSTELTARKKQYNFYRDKLLTFEDGDVEWKSLGELVDTIKTGKLNANAMVEDGNYPFFTCDAKPFRIDTYAFDTEAIIVSGNGSQVGHINYYNGKFNAYQRTYIIADCSSLVNMVFLLTFLRAYLRPYIMQHSKKGSVPYITMPMLQNFKIPIPSIERQAKITSTLDKFDALTNSITEGLPREIELRHKQYEYYRDLLLSFPKPNEAAA